MLHENDWLLGYQLFVDSMQLEDVSITRRDFILFKIVALIFYHFLNRHCAQSLNKFLLIIHAKYHLAHDVLSGIEKMPDLISFILLSNDNVVIAKAEG